MPLSDGLCRDSLRLSETIFFYFFFFFVFFLLLLLLLLVLLLLLLCGFSAVVSKNLIMFIINEPAQFCGCTAEIE